MCVLTSGSVAVTPLSIEISSPHMDKLNGVMPWALHGLDAVQ